MRIKHILALTLRRSALVLLTFAISISAAVAQQIVLVRGPQGIVMPVGAPAQTDSFVLANAGPGRASVSLTANGTFFTSSPSSAILSPGSAVLVTIRSNVPSSGFFAGSVNVSIPGVLSPLVVPLRIAAIAPPALPVNATAQVTVLSTFGPAGSSHQGTWKIGNSGTGTLRGMLTSGMPWLVPQSDIVTVPARGSTQITFVVDRRRAFGAPLGAIAADLTLLYLTDTGSTASLSATVIDISRPPVMPSSVSPAAAPGETISFLPVVSDGSSSHDLLFATRGSSGRFSDLKLFYSASGAPVAFTILADPSALAAGFAAWFPFAPSSLFSSGNETGTVQVRSSDPRTVAAAITRSIVPDGVNRYLTALPTLRSDRAVLAGDRFVFAGVEKSANAHTDIFLQETAGLAGAYTVDFFDASGAPIAPSLSGSILPFGSAGLSDVAPSGARSARVTNTSSGDARLTGFALVVDDSTSDAWTIVDSSRSPGATTDLVLPVPGGAPSPSSFDAWITNASSSPAFVTIGATATSMAAKTRAVRRGTSGTEAAVPSIILLAGETRQVPLTGMAFVHISGPAGAISATGRLTTTAAKRAGAFGTGVPAIPSARAAGVGGPVSHFFRASDVPDVSPPTLLLLEVANRPATVRVTTGFSFPAGAVGGSAHFESSKDYDVAPGQLLSIPDVVRSVLGTQRDVLGNLINVVIDVEVVGGEGRVLPYLQSVDSSGDLTLSAD